MDTRDVRKMLQAIASTAQEAADEAKERMYSAGQSLSDKYDAAKLNLALSRTKGEQERIFTDMGRIQFLMNTGKYLDFEAEHITPKQIMDHLMIAAEQKQQEIDRIRERLEKVSGTSQYCPSCGRRCEEDAKFCPECGTALVTKAESSGAM